MVGRAAGNRLPVFAARAAPVQVGWLDAFYPSGIDAMDYLVTDPWLSPQGADANFSERLMRLPHGRLAYSPPPVAPGECRVGKNQAFRFAQPVLEIERRRHRRLGVHTERVA